MIISLQTEITDDERAEVESVLNEFSLSGQEVRTQSGYFLVVPGNSNSLDVRRIGHLSGVADVFVVPDPYKLVSRTWRVKPTLLDFGDGIEVGEGSLTLMLGPCSIESEEQIEGIAKFLADHEVRFIRGGAFKPRSSPYSFRGLGLEGCRLIKEAAKRHGLRVISEVLEPSHIEQMYDFVDIYQVGARNNQNFSLLHALGTVDKPVLIKRGMSGTLEELLQSAEYVFANGNERILLCERGIRTFEKAYRNTFDINAIPLLKEKSHLPVIADPSHGIGIRSKVTRVALAAAVAGADGLLCEIHQTPEKARSDGQQTLNFEEAAQLINQTRQVAALSKEWSYGSTGT